MRQTSIAGGLGACYAGYPLGGGEREGPSPLASWAQRRVSQRRARGVRQCRKAPAISQSKSMDEQANSPYISVIIPCYNHGRYLPEAVKSVVAQTIGDWEL